MVMAQTSLDKVVVTADGDGVLSHAGSTLLVGLADQVGLTEALSVAMEPTRERVSAHDPGVVLRDLAVMLVDGGTCLSDLGGLRERASRLGAAVASDSTAYRVISSIDQAGLERLRSAVASARARAWELGGGVRGPVVLDFDATLVGAFSRKQGAAGTFKGGFGHHPLLCYLDGSREALAGAEEDLLAFYRFPAAHWSKLRSTNPLERVNREIGRRADVVGIFPNDQSAMRLAGAVLIEQNDEWLVSRRYLSDESLALILDADNAHEEEVAELQGAA